MIRNLWPTSPAEWASCVIVFAVIAFAVWSLTESRR